MVLPNHQPLRCSRSRTGIEPGMCPQPPKQAKLQVALEVVRKDMQETLAQETTLGKKIIIWKEKVETQRQRFRLEFEKYRGFLAQEEQLQLRRLEEEERATLSRLRDSKGHLSQRGRALRELIQELEEQSQRPALGLLELMSSWTLSLPIQVSC